MVIITLILIFISGMFEGFIEALKYRYKRVKYLSPFLSDRFWDPAISHTNKYKGHNALLGPKFPLSTTALVWLTDGYHLINTIGNSLLFISVSLSIGASLPEFLPKINPYLEKTILWAILHAAYAAGNSLMIDVIFRKDGNTRTNH